MKRQNIVLPMLVTALLLVSSGPLLGQQKPNPAPKKTIPLSGSALAVPDLSLFVEANYSGVKLPDVDARYRLIEKNLMLPGGDDFEIPYFVVAGLRFSPIDAHSVQAEFGGSVLKTAKDTTTNFFQAYYAGGSYLYSFPLGFMSVFAGGGMGYMWLNTERTYSTRTGVARVNGRMIHLHAVLGIEFYSSSGVSFAIEGKYDYATTVSPARSDLDMTLKGASGGLKIGIPLVMSLGL